MPGPYEVLETILDGQIAYGWPYDGGRLVLDTDTAMRGYVQRAATGEVEFQCLDDDPYGTDHFRNPPVAPSAIALMTSAGPALLTDLRERVGWQSNFGGGTASHLTYRAGVLLSGLDLWDLRAPKLTRLSVVFEGLDDWSGVQVIQRSPGQPTAGTTSFNLSTVSKSNERVPSTSLQLEYGPRWQTRKQGQGGLLLTAGIDAGMIAARPRTARELMMPLYAVQDLLGLIFGGHVNARPGTAEIPRQPPRGFICSYLAPLMTEPQAGLQVDWHRSPTVGFDDIGRAAGIARWIDLYEKHPRAVLPLVDPYRRGSVEVQAGLLRLGAAVDYWVSWHRKKRRKWALGGPTKAHSLASVGGVAFRRWIGEPEAWADKFWSTYNKVKHDPSIALRTDDVFLLTQSCDWLLRGVILDRIATTSAPSRALFGEWRKETFAEDLRKIL
jgi:hypothetical protein